MTREQALLDTVVAQRNNALNECATLMAELSVAQERIKELEAKIPPEEKKED